MGKGMAPLVKYLFAMRRLQEYILPGLLFAVFVVAYYPALRLFAVKWSVSEDYFHAFLVVPAIGYMVWSKRACLVNRPGSSVAGCILVMLSILFYLASLRLQIPTLIFLATGSSLVSALVFIAGFRALKDLVMPILLFLLIIPIPSQLLSAVTATLQLEISKASEFLIRLFSIPMYREGNMLYFQQMAFQVIDACSGVRSLISMTTFSVIVSYFTLTRLWSALFLFLFSIPVAILINILRVVFLALAFHYFDLNLSEGILHTITGLVLFIFGLTMLFAFQRILESWERKSKKRIYS